MSNLAISVEQFLQHQFAVSNIVEVIEIPYLGISGAYRANNWGELLIPAGGTVWSLTINGELDDPRIFYGLQAQEFGGDYALESWYDHDLEIRILEVFVDLPELGFYAPVSI